MQTTKEFWSDKWRFWFLICEIISYLLFFTRFILSVVLDFRFQLDVFLLREWWGCDLVIFQRQSLNLLLLLQTLLDPILVVILIHKQGVDLSPILESWYVLPNFLLLLFKVNFVQYLKTTIKENSKRWGGKTYSTAYSIYCFHFCRSGSTPSCQMTSYANLKYFDIFKFRNDCFYYM